MALYWYFKCSENSELQDVYLNSSASQLHLYPIPTSSYGFQKTGNERLSISYKVYSQNILVVTTNSMISKRSYNSHSFLFPLLLSHFSHV